jgi:hypothetical protein
MDEAAATTAARYCLDVLTDGSAFVARTTPPFHVAHYTLKALAGLLDAADDAFHRDLAAFLTGLPVGASYSIHVMRPAHTHGSARRVDPVGQPFQPPG